MNRNSDPHQEVESLAVDLQQLANRGTPAYGLFVESVAEELSHAAKTDETLDSARQTIESYQQNTALLHETLTETLASIERIQQARVRREKYSQRWWEQTIEALHHQSSDNPDVAFQQLLVTYGQALVDWQLDICRRLVEESLPVPREQRPYVLLIRHGDAALQTRNYPATLQMLDYLVGRFSESTSPDDRVLGMLLSIFIGRIRLYQTNEPELAVDAFDRAASLAPQDGRPLAAKGHASLAQGESGWAEANRLFSRAIESSPQQPDGYVGKAMLAEARSQWAEADDWYKASIREARDEPDLAAFAGKMLAPGTGRLYLHIGHQLLEDGAPDRALAAVERCLELEMNDDSRYPTRAALALKADAMAAMHGEAGSEEETRKIADLYYEAGRYYSWNGEGQNAVDLFRKALSVDIKIKIPMVLFYLADNLRVLSYSSKPPYYSSEQIVYESRDTWDEGMRLSGLIDADNAWVYVARAYIAKQLACLPLEDEKEHYWQAILFNERALLLNDHPGWWTTLSDSYNGLSLYANMLRVAAKNEKDIPDDIGALEGRATVLVNTGQFEPARTILKSLIEHKDTDQNSRTIYQSWQAVVDYYSRDYDDALRNLSPRLEQTPDDLWSVDLRESIYLGKREYDDAINDAQWIWDQRANPKYKSDSSEFARAAFWLGMYDETLDRVSPMLNSSAALDRYNAQLWSGLVRLVQGDFPKADELLFKALDASNPRSINDLIMNLERLLDRATQKDWPLQKALREHLANPEGILALAQAKQVRMTTYTADPVKELEDVVSSPVTGKPGSSSWLAAQAGLGRLHLEANQLEAATDAYQALSIYSDQVPEAEVGLNKVRSAAAEQRPAEIASS